MTQVTLGFQVVQMVVLNDEPVERATYHWPVCAFRPAMSASPSPLKSPVWTSTKLEAGAGQMSQN
jgi:hypothetical protein